MLSLAAAANLDVVEVYKDARDDAENSVHKALEGLSRVLEAKRHPEELPETKWCYNGSLLDVVGCHGDLVVAAGQVNLRENGLPRQVAVEVADVRDRVAVVDGSRVEPSKVTAGAPAPVGFGHDMQWGGPRRIRAADDAQVLHLLELGPGNG